ncbi:MAG: hypothetical protein AB7R69_05350 [Candidatus Babeliales bacterium]
MVYNRLLGLILIGLGFGVIFFSLGELLFRLILAFLGIMLINHGLRMYGVPVMVHVSRARRTFWQQ